MNKHIKQSVVLFAASALSVMLGVVTSVFNTSMLSPSEYGDVRYVNNILNFVASLLLFGYFVSGSRMLALSKDENRSRQIRGVAFYQPEKSLNKLGLLPERMDGKHILLMVL